jgi:arylsulfatase A-like enzyme
MAGLLIVLVLGACSTSEPPAEASAAPPVVIFVGMDTTRADALGPYGREDAQTPVLDILAKRGVVFEWALSHAPTTLSSFTSVFSGHDSHRHRIPRNGYPVPGDVELLAERFTAAGWLTFAAVGSAALEAKMGLGRGFSIYDDTARGQGYEARADQVNAALLSHLDARSPAERAQPTFLFAHYYDPHQPWNSAPPELRASLVDPSYQGPVSSSPEMLRWLSDPVNRRSMTAADHAHADALYQAEISWTDVALGMLLRELQHREMLQNSLLVVFSDHGEHLGENPIDLYYGHGPDVDLGILRVPLILSGSGDFPVPRGVRVTSPVRLMDLGATTLSLAGLKPSLGAGRDLSATWSMTPLTSLPSFAEASRPVEAESPPAWQNLYMERSVVADGHMLLRSPGEPDALYRLAVPPVLVADPERVTRLGEALMAWDAAAPPYRDITISDDTVEGLQALGYME